nr:hypothetical protein [Pseudoxanthomonas mexicana]
MHTRSIPVTPVQGTRSLFVLRALCFIALFAVLAGAQAVEQRQLDQGWEFRRISAGAGDEDPAGIGSAWRPASMPGTVHTDLLAHGLIPDPYVGAPE